MSTPATDPVVESSWLMLAALPRPAQEEIHQALACLLHRPTSAAEERVEQLLPLARLLQDLGQWQYRTTDKPLAATEAKRRADFDPDKPHNPRKDWRTMDREVYDLMAAKDAVSSKRLVEKYGSWRKVCRAADGLIDDGRYTGVGRPWDAATTHDPGVALYTRWECVRAIKRCRDKIGHQPSSHEYIQWRRRIIKRLPRADRKQLGLPTYEVIKHRFGGWENATDWSQKKLTRDQRRYLHKPAKARKRRKATS